MAIVEKNIFVFPPFFHSFVVHIQSITSQSTAKDDMKFERIKGTEKMKGRQRERQI